MHEATLVRTTQFNESFKDNTLNVANINYSNFINGQKAKFANLFNDYVDEYTALQVLKNSNVQPSTESVNYYNTLVRSYNTKKNAFYEVYNTIQSAKKVLYDSWFVSNSAFLKNNGEFENIHDVYVITK